MKVHEHILLNNKQKFYLGTVTNVMRKETGDVQDALGNNLFPKEILFSVGDILTGARATPLQVTSEVNIGEVVIIMGLESIYNNTFYYFPIRNITGDHETIHMTYNNAEIEFVPVDESKTDLILAAGKTLIVLDSDEQKINLKSGYGGIKLDATDGLIDIRNSGENLHGLMEELIKQIKDLKTVKGDVIQPAQQGMLMALSARFGTLLGDVDDSKHDPHLPNDTYTVEFAAQAVAETGMNFLSDDGPEDPGVTITNLQNSLPADTNTPTPNAPENSDAQTSTTVEVIELCGLDNQTLSPSSILSPNYTLGDLSTKCTFPHKLKSQHSRSKLEIACNLKNVALNILEPIKAQYPNVRVNSGFRGKPSLKNRVSQHEIGEAIDIQFPGMTPQEYFEASKWVTENILFDQFIFEHGNSIWFHLSFRSGSNRKKLLTMYQGNYTSGTTLYYT